MKTKTVILTIFVLAFVCSAFASELPKMNVVTLSKSKVYVTALTNQQFPTEVSLYNYSGDIVYYKKSEAAEQFRSVLNLCQLEDGSYTVCLKNGDVTTQRKLEINCGCVCVRRKIKEMEPVFWHKDGLVYVTFLNWGEANVSMAVYNNNELLQETELGKDFNLQRCFDLTKHTKGDFDFVLHGSNRDYNYHLSR